jgi:hypothetical protein
MALTSDVGSRSLKKKDIEKKKDMYGAQRALWDRDEIKQAGAPLRQERGSNLA